MTTAAPAFCSQRIIILVVFATLGLGISTEARPRLPALPASAPGAGNDEIGRCQQLGHVVDVPVTNQVFAGGKPLLLFKILKQLDAAAAGGVQMQRVPAGLLFPRAEIRHDLIDAVGTQAAAKAEDDCCGRRFGSCGRAARGLPSGPRGGPGCRQRSFYRCAELFDCIGTGGQHDVDLSGQQLVRHAGEGVLLMDGRLDAAARARTIGPLTQPPQPMTRSGRT